MSDAERRERIDIEKAIDMWENGFDVFVNGTQLPAYDNDNYDNNLVTYNVLRDAHDGGGKTWCAAYTDDILRENEIDGFSDAFNTIISVLEHRNFEYDIKDYALEANEFMPFKWNDGENVYQNIEAALAEGNVQFIQSYLNDIIYDTAASSLFNGPDREYSIPNGPHHLFNDLEHLKEALDAYADKYGKEPPEYLRVNIGELDKEDLGKLVNHLKANGYDVLWDKNYESFITTVDEIDYIKTILNDRDIANDDIDVVTKSDFAELIEQNSLICPVPTHEIPKDLAMALWERDTDIYANGVRTDVFAYTTNEKADKMWNKLWSQDITLSVSENDYGKINLANKIALAVGYISEAAKNMEDTLHIYAAHANEETPFPYDLKLSDYRNVLNACLDNNVYFIQEWLEDVEKNNPSLLRVSDYEGTGIPSMTQLREDIKTYIDTYIFEPEPKTDITIRCDLCETFDFDEGKTYSVAEFDKIMKEAEENKQFTRNELIEKYGSADAVREALNKKRDEYISENGAAFGEYQYIATAMRYDKVKFTIEFPNGNTITERQNIGDGHKGVIEYMKSCGYVYGQVVKELEAQIDKDAVSFLLEEQRAEWYTPHIYVQNSEPASRRYILCPKYPDDTVLGEYTCCDSVEKAREIGQKYLQNYLDPHSLAPSDKKFEGYAIHDSQKHRIIERCGVTQEEVFKNFTKEVERNTLAAEALEKGKGVATMARE